MAFDRIFSDETADIRRLDLQRRTLLAKAIIVPSYSELHDDSIAAVARLVLGKSAFAYPFGKNEARTMMGAVTIMGIAPQSQEDWKLVEETLGWRMETCKALAELSRITCLQPTSQTASLGVRRK